MLIYPLCTIYKIGAHRIDPIRIGQGPMTSAHRTNLRSFKIDGSFGHESLAGGLVRFEDRLAGPGTTRHGIGCAKCLFCQKGPNMAPQELGDYIEFFVKGLLDFI